MREWERLSPWGRSRKVTFDMIINVNLRGLLFTVQKSLPLMKNGGVIVLCGSTNTIVTSQGLSVYSASKAEYARSRIRGHKN